MRLSTPSGANSFAMDVPSEQHAVTTRAHASEALKVRELNELLTCYLCKGYIIDPATVDNCWHSYCRSCIVQHLLGDSYCPQCRSIGSKHINVSISNLKSDDVLRALIYKLVPGLYQRERERIVQFHAGLCNGQRKSQDEPGSICKELELDENLFSPTEPISLSLEYHPALLNGCNSSEIPPVRYLQCPAGLKIRHLKRFLCSKYDIDPENKRIEVEVIYEDEVLPNDFSLMDVGYCYNWKRHAPMKFTYRILFYGGRIKSGGDSYCKNDEKLNTDFETNNQKPTQVDKPLSSSQGKSVSFSDESNTTLSSPTCFPNTKAQMVQTAVVCRNKSKSKKPHGTELKESPSSTASEVSAPVKVVIARKTSNAKKSSPKRSSCDEPTYVVTNDFKSLRSNDMRYSDYAVTSTTNCNNTSAPKTTQRSPKAEEENVSMATLSENPVSKCDIVVSIPHSQMPKSPYAADDQFENVSLAQLKTASKKSPNAAVAVISGEPTKGASARNVPKLKIELNSLKSKLTIPKPKSADAQLEDLCEIKRIKHRKHSLDESGHIADRVDLETYAKNIGLQPIEVLTPLSSEPCDKLKYSPSASPLSSSSSSTTSSSNSNFPMVSCADIVSSSFHRKRKKKHSKESKGSNGKRKRLHAEISSQLEEESLKMKVKITPSHSHKAHRMESKKVTGEAVEGNEEIPTSTEDKRKNDEMTKSIPTIVESSQMNESLAAALNKTLCEESKSINHLMKDKEEPNEGNATSNVSLLPKSLSNIKETKIPSSPPLPPSLFKTTALTFNTLSVTNTAVSQPKPTSAALKQPEVAKEQINLTKVVTTTTTTAMTTQATASSSTASSVGLSSLKSNTNTAEKPLTGQKGPHFVVPSLPRRTPPVSMQSHKFFGTPSSIASSTNKQIGMQLKRSASLDETYNSTVAPKKQHKLEQERLMRKNIYGSFSGSAQTASSTVKYPNSLSISHREEKRLASPTDATGATLDLALYAPHVPAYVHERGKRRPMSTPSSLSICKITDISCNVQSPSSTNAVTITARQRPTVAPAQWSPMSYGQTHLPLNKPAVEIVRITSNQIPADLQPLPPISPPRGSRLMGPPQSMLKGRKTSGQQIMPLSTAALSSSTVRSPPLMVNSIATGQGRNHHSYRTSPPALINLRTIYPSKQCGNADSSPKALESNAKTNGSAEKATSSLREFRPTSKDGSVDILDVTTVSGKGQESSNGTSPAISNSLEAALNKIKQNITSSTVQDSVSAKKQKLGVGESSGDDLQNLHMLSESATTREKITIRSATQLFEKPKSQQSSMVRQQNASVRNIPNPSALAFRNISTLPAASNNNTTLKTAVTSSPPSCVSQKKPTTSLSTSAGSGERPHALSTTSSSVPSNPIATLPSTVRTIKKPTTIDQVAANLNMRAAAAEAHAAKSSVVEDTSQITSTTKTCGGSTVTAREPSSASELTRKLSQNCESTTSSAETVGTMSASSADGVEKPMDNTATALAPASPISVSNNNNNNSSSNNNLTSSGD